MAQIDKVQVIDRRILEDERGWFLKAITGMEDELPNYTGEVYLTMCKPGFSKGGHYHNIAKEWFTVIQGSAVLLLEDTVTHETRRINMRFDNPKTVFVPNGVAHKVIADDEKGFILLAYTDTLYDSKDTVVYSF